MGIEGELSNEHFRVVVFGSARIRPGSPQYKMIFNLSKQIGAAGWDIVTGGGPGLMEAATGGHFLGRKNTGVHEIGLQIKLPHEQHDSAHLDVKAEFSRFSQRLDTFMVLANVVVVAPGGVGTLLELLYTWQLMQVHHTCKLPIILLGDMWPGFVEWVKKWPLNDRLLNDEDVNLLYIAKTTDDAMRIIKKAYREHKRDPGSCTNYQKYRLE